MNFVELKISRLNYLINLKWINLIKYLFEVSIIVLIYGNWILLGVLVILFGLEEYQSAKKLDKLEKQI